MRLHRLVFSLVVLAVLAAPTRAFEKKHSSLESTLAIRVGGNRVYRVFVSDATSSCGTWTATTGPAHPSGPGRNIFFGDGFPASSDTTLRSYTSSIDYRTGSECQGLCATATPVVSAFLHGSALVGYRLTWTFEDGKGGPVVQFTQDVLVSGPVDGTENVNNSAIRETHTVRNLGPGELRYGIRKLWDWQIDSDDGPWFGDCRTPDRACDLPLNLTAAGPGAYPRNYLVNEQPSIAECPAGVPPRDPAGCGGPPAYIVAGTVAPPSILMPPPNAPELLQVNGWPILFGSCWQPRLVSDGTCDAGDTAIAYFYGLAPESAHVLAAGEERSYTQYVVAGTASCPAAIQEADTRPPLCSLAIDPGTPPSARGEALDNRPSEDANGNGVLDPGEDLDGNGLIDRDTGIRLVELAPGAVNLTLSVDPFVPGDPLVRFALAPTEPAHVAVGIVRATDGASNACDSTIQLGSFRPFGDTIVTTTNQVTAVIERPGETTAAVRCVEAADPGSPDFGKIPFAAFTTDPVRLELLLSAGDGVKAVCCQFLDLGGATSPAVCSSIVLATCPEGRSCEDGNACTSNDICQGGVCVGGPPTNCDDGTACTIDRCDPTTGCEHEAGGDGDGDGVADCQDLCPRSILDPTVVIPASWPHPPPPGTAPGSSQPCDSGVPNVVLAGGCTISDQLAVCFAGSRTRGQLERCLDAVLYQLQRRQAITEKQRKAIDKCVKRMGQRSGAGRPQRPRGSSAAAS